MSVKDNLGGSAIEGNATASQVLSGKTFMSESADELQTGTMANNGAWSQTVTPSASAQEVGIPEGYHSGSGKVTVNAGTVLSEMSFITGAAAEAQMSGSSSVTKYSSYIYVPCANYSKVKVEFSSSNSSGFGSVSSDFPTGTFDTNGASTYKIGRMHVVSTSASIKTVGAVFVKVTLIP